MKKIFSLSACSLFVCNCAFSQNVGVNTDGTAAETGVMLDVKGSNAKTSTALQNIFQIKSADASTDALKLRFGLGTDVTPGSRYGVIDVPDYVGSSVSAYRHLALQPLGGFVGIGTISPFTRLHVANKLLPNAHYTAFADAVVQGGEGRLQIIGEDQSWGSAALCLTDIFSPTENRHWTLQHRTSLAAPFSNKGNSLNIGYIATSASGQDVFNQSASNIKMTIDTSGFVGIGTSFPQTNLEVSAYDQRTAIQIVNTGGTVARNPRLNIYNYNDFGGSPVIQFHNMRGTSTVPSATLLGYGLGNIDFGGYDGTALYDGGQIAGTTTENPTATAHGSALLFTTVSNGTISLVERMRIDQSGYVGIGTTAPEATLHVATGITTNPRGIVNQQSTNDANSAFIELRKSRGTITAPTVVQSGDALGTVLSEAYDGTAFIRTGGMVKFTANGTISAGSVPTDLIFTTGSSGLGTQRLRITSTGFFEIPLTSLPVYANNAAAIAGGLGIGMLYRTGGDPSVVCVVF